MLCRSFPREPADEGGAQHKVWNALTQLEQQLLCVILWGAVHAEQHQVIDVLQGDVNVLGDLGVGGNLIDQLIGEVRGVGVQNAHPMQSLQLAKLAHEQGQVAPISPILSILIGVLCDEIDLPNPALNQVLGLVQQCLPGLAPELAPEAWNGAEGARVVTALRDPQVRGVRGGEAHTIPLWPERDCGTADLHASRVRHQHPVGRTSRPTGCGSGRGGSDREAHLGLQAGREGAIVLKPNNQVRLR
mmetsp:Transcript_19009/g.32523  ORF Transcript_19009/g.32523 Transcript_19009/m.32523 type:complete len:245 (+) Transcript_19009:993-1727(+)